MSDAFQQHVVAGYHLDVNRPLDLFLIRVVYDHVELVLLCIYSCTSLCEMEGRLECLPFTWVKK